MRPVRTVRAGRKPLELIERKGAAPPRVQSVRKACTTAPRKTVRRKVCVKLASEGQAAELQNP